uniref:Uncharacterized protein n=1 Tax=Jakoba libera TaxID=143017 RepID=M4QLD8_JAKLI|nr:hypothetical protein L048_p003 [Jakoba libera]AGH24253.1 hypothetical protein [Jakoba libera]
MPSLSLLIISFLIFLIPLSITLLLHVIIPIINPNFRMIHY